MKNNILEKITNFIFTTFVGMSTVLLAIAFIGLIFFLGKVIYHNPVAGTIIVIVIILLNLLGRHIINKHTNLND